MRSQQQKRVGHSSETQVNEMQKKLVWLILFAFLLHFHVSLLHDCVCAAEDHPVRLPARAGGEAGLEGASALHAGGGRRGRHGPSQANHPGLDEGDKEPSAGERTRCCPSSSLDPDRDD